MGERCSIITDVGLNVNGIFQVNHYFKSISEKQFSGYKTKERIAKSMV